MQDPHNEYVRRLEQRVAAATELDRYHIAIGNLKVGVVAATALLAWVVLAYRLFPPWVLAAPAAAFAALAIYHERVLRRRRRAARAAAFYERGIARIEGRWQGTGFGGEPFEDPAHPYSEDLDLFGKGSLYELLCTARLRTGEQTLARWLLNPAPLDEIRARQQAVDELRERVDLREDLSLLGEEIRSGVNPGDLARWGEEPIVLDSRGARIGAAALALAAVITALVWWQNDVAAPFLAVAIAEVVFFLRYRRRIQRVVARVGEPAYGLALFSEVLERIEREKFASPKLVALRRELETQGLPPSRHIARLNRLMELLDSRDNLLVRVIGPPLLWVPQLAFAIEAWRRHNGQAVHRWIAAAGEIEALTAFAAYAYEHPNDPFPEIAEGTACFDAQGAAHPLLLESRAVRNDLRMGDELKVLVVSGSNMSGKSTLLRTVGTNAVLAMAGAPVRAHRMRISPLSVGASIRTMDSLQDGTSRFYTEIKRLRQIMDLTKAPRPVLFLLDELLHGTNSHDRAIGGEAVVRGLVERGAVGLLTTHDLALSHIAEELAPRAANVHFEDRLQNGTITFDYKLRPGVVRKSNALELMRSVGLEV